MPYTNSTSAFPRKAAAVPSQISFTRRLRKSRVSRSAARTDTSMVQLPAAVLQLEPPWMVPTSTIVRSSIGTSRAMISCRAMAAWQAMLMASTPLCGVEPWASFPSKVTRMASPE